MPRISLVGVCHGSSIYWVDEDGKTRTEETLYLHFNTHIVMCCAADRQSTWKFQSFERKKFQNIQSSSTISLNFDENSNLLKLHLTKIRFSSAGIYACISSSGEEKRLTVHILAVTNATNDVIKLNHYRAFIAKFQIRIGHPQKTTTPTVSCTFRLAKPRWDTVEVRWRGGLYATNPKLYSTTTEIDRVQGSLVTTMSVATPILKAKIYGKYQCELLINQKVRISSEVDLFIPPILAEPRMDMYLSPGETLEYLCDVIAHPPLTKPILWARYQRPIDVDQTGAVNVEGMKENNRITIDSVKWVNDRLKIVPLFDEDDATYSCFAQNERGNATGAFNLRVKREFDQSDNRVKV
ncbi:unnamed protein product [Echinostoma caproni]|uniref:Ig-like domain-containing protein n=1 Tax=Echinostoma caproni TaxID=27848 RepID=A0A183AJE5_9TREM|nr:unnamed protein product [Echinostoma caproni]